VDGGADFTSTNPRPASCGSSRPHRGEAPPRCDAKTPERGIPQDESPVERLHGGPHRLDLGVAQADGGLAISRISAKFSSTVQGSKVYPVGTTCSLTPATQERAPGEAAENRGHHRDGSTIPPREPDFGGLIQEALRSGGHRRAPGAARHPGTDRVSSRLPWEFAASPQARPSWSARETALWRGLDSVGMAAWPVSTSRGRRGGVPHVAPGRDLRGHDLQRRG
jgi:hypothetical protein